MNNNEKSSPHITGCGVFMLFIAALLFFTLSCSKKAQIEYVDREVVKYTTQIRHDTLINNVHDSIFHTIFQSGDTIYNTKYVEHIKYRDRIVNKIDTVTRDSVQVRYKYIENVKKETPKWCYYTLFISVILSIFVGILGCKNIKKWLKR